MLHIHPLYMYLTFSYWGSCCSSLEANKFPSRQRREILDSVRMTSGRPPSSSVFSSTLSTFSLLHLARAAGNTLMLLQLKFNSTPLKTSMPFSGSDSSEFDERSAKSKWVSWQRKSGKCLSLLCERTTFLRDFRLTRESGREVREFLSRFSVSSFFRLPRVSGKWAVCVCVHWERERERESERERKRTYLKCTTKYIHLVLHHVITWHCSYIFGYSLAGHPYTRVNHDIMNLSCVHVSHNLHVLSF